MQNTAMLLQAIASLLWPIFAFAVLFAFKSEFTDIAKRLRKGKLFGQEIELGESLERLSASAQSIQEEVASLPQTQDQPKRSEDKIIEQDVVRNIIGEASRSPKTALISLAVELERLAIEVLATTGNLRGRQFVPVRQAITELHLTYGLPSHVPSSLKHFWDVRNRLIHLGQGTDEDILRAIDSGISILKALQAMPREINIVHKTDIPIFEDPELKKEIQGARGVILESHSPGTATTSYRIFPTTKSHFTIGKRVSWEWNLRLIYGAAWFRDPETDEIKPAWNGSAEFIGRPLDSINTGVTLAP